MPKDPYRKITFYADADVKKRLDKLDPGIKSHTINELLRQGFEKGESVEKRIEGLEARLQVLQKDVQVDGFSIAAIRGFLMSRFGGRAAEEIAKQFDDIYYGSTPLPAKKPAAPQAVPVAEKTQPKQSKLEKKSKTAVSAPGGFESFTEKALKVIMLAQEESRRTGHNYVGTEQILLGLIGEATGIAAKTLTAMGANLRDARTEVQKIIGRGSGFVAVEIPFTPRAKRVLELSADEARKLGHSYIGTEHLLLALLREGEGVAARVLENLGVNLEKLKIKILRELGEPDAP